MTHIDNIKKISTLFPLAVTGLDALETAAAQKFTSRLWGSSLIDRKSIEGRLCDKMRKWLPLAKGHVRFHSIFTEALSHCRPAIIEALPLASQGPLHEIHQDHFSPQSPPLGLLEQALQATPDLPRGALHWSQDVDFLHRTSLLRGVEESPHAPSPSIFQAFFTLPHASLDVQDLRILVAYLGQFIPLTSVEQPLQEALTREERLESLSTKGIKEETREEAKTELAMLAEELAQEIGALRPQEKKVIIGGTIARAPKLNLKALQSPFFEELQRMLNADVLADHAKNLSVQIISALKAKLPRSENSDLRLQTILQKGLVAQLFPGLSTSLFHNRSLAAKILLAPAEGLRLGVLKGSESICHWLTENLSKKLTDLIAEQGMEEFYEAAKEGNLPEVLEKKLTVHLQQALDLLRTSFLQKFSELTDFLPSYTPLFMQTFKIGDPGSVEQPVWFEIEKGEENLFTLSVYAGGPAAYLHTSNSNATPQVKIQYRNVEGNRLDGDFFHTLLSYRTLPRWDSQASYSLNDLYNGLLHSLGQDPSDLSNLPEALSGTFSAYRGQIGTLFAYLQGSLGFTGGVDEEDLLFHIQKRLLLDGAKQADHSSWQKGGELFLEKSAARLKEGKITREEFQQIYATVWEMGQRAPSLQGNNPQKPVFVPIEIAARLRSLLSNISPDLQETMKDLLIGAGGEGMKTAIDAVEADLPPPLPPVAKTVADRAKELGDAALNITLGLSLKDFTSPSYWTLLKVAVLAARIALIIFVPGFGLTVSLIMAASSVGLQAIAKGVFFFFPETTRTLMRIKNRFIGRWFAQLILGKKELADFDGVLHHFRAVAARSGELSFSLPLNKPPLSVKNLRVVSEKINPVARSLMAPAPLFIPPIDVQPLDERQVLMAINDWMVKANSLPAEGGLYLIDQTKNLPVPMPGMEDDCWSRIPQENITITLEAIGSLALKLVQIAAKKNLSPERSAHVTINLFKAYAIIDKLARRCPESRLNGFTPNGWALAHWNKEALFRLYDPMMRSQLKAVQTYFGIDPERDAHKDWNSTPSIADLAKNSLFFIKTGICFIQQVSDCPVLEAYLQQFLDDPLIIERFHYYGIDAEDPYIDRITCLYANPCVDVQNKTEEELERIQKVFNPDGTNPRLGILSYSFHMLHMINILANHFISGMDIRSFLTVQSPDEALFSIEDKDNHVRKFLHTISGGRAFTTNESSPLDLIPGARYTDLVGRRVQNGWRPLNRIRFSSSEQDIVSFSGDRRHSNITSIISSFLHFSARKPNEITNDIAAFIKPREEKQNSLVEWARKIGHLLNGETHYPNYLSQMPESERRVLEMIRFNPEEQAVRTIAYFSQKIDKLEEIGFRFLFRTLLLQGDLLYPYLQKHPEFGETLGLFFKRALAYYTERSDWATVISLLEIGIWTRAYAEAAHPESGIYFPDFRTHLLPLRKEKKYREIASFLLALPWFFVDPESATSQQKEGAAWDLSLSYLCFDSLKTFPLKEEIEEVWLKWKGELKKTLDKLDSLSHQILNKIAEEKGLLNEENNPVRWQGAFPHYYSGELHLQFDLLTGLSVFSANSPELRLQIEGELKQIFDRPIPVYGTLKKGCYEIESHQMGIELSQERNEDFHRLSFFKLHEGKKYYWTKTTVLNGYTTWMGERDEEGNGQLLLLDRKGAVFQIRHFESQEETVAQVNGNRLLIGGELCEEVDLSNDRHHLGLLSWFQPLTSIKAYRSVKEPSQIRRIDFTELKISFPVVQGQAVGEGPLLTGLIISPHQAQHQRYPVLHDHTRYLLLENSRGEHKVALPSDTLYSMAIFGALGSQMVGYTSQLLDVWADPLIHEMLNGNWTDPRGDKMLVGERRQAPYYVYDITPSGSLTSANPDALLHLFCRHLAQKSVADALQNLRLIERLGRRKRFSPGFFALVLETQTATIAIDDPRIRRMTLRLSAIAEENRLIQTDESADGRPLPELFLTWLLLQKLYYGDLTRPNPHTDYGVELTEFQELFVLHALERFSKRLIEYADIPSSIQILIEKLGIQGLMWTLLTHPAVANRYAFLQQKQDKQKKRGALPGILGSIVQGASQLLLGRQENVYGPLISHLLSIVKNWVNAPNAEALKIDLLAVGTETSWKEVPLSAAAITREDWILYMPLYYLLAHPTISEELKGNQLFLSKKAQFARMLDLIKGRSFDLPSNLNEMGSLNAWIDLLRLIVSHPAHNRFPLPSEFSKKLEEGKSLDKEVRELAQLRISNQFYRALHEISLLDIPVTQILKELAYAYGLGSLSQGKAILSSLRDIGASLVGRAVPLPLPQQIVAEESLFPVAYLQELEEEDALMGGVSQQIVQIHGKVERAQEIQKIPIFEVENQHRLIQKMFGRLNQSLVDYYSQELPDSPLYKPTTLAAFYAWGADLKKGRKILEPAVEKLKCEILYTAHSIGPDSTPNRFSVVIEKEEIYFQELIQAFGRGDRRWIETRTQMQPAGLVEFQKKIYQYLLQATRLQQLKRALKIWKEAQAKELSDPSTQVLLSQLSFEMTRTRAYSLVEGPERLIRAYLLFEYGTETMLWKNQVVQIQKMLLAPTHKGVHRYVLELKTGSGKTSFGTPLISYFGANGGEAREIYNCFPDALSTGGIEQVCRTSQTVFGQMGNAVEITRGKYLEEENLWALLQAHRRALVDNEHFNGRKKDLQSLELRFIKALYDYKKGKGQELLGAYKTLLAHIRTDVRGNIDEAHLLFRRNEELNYPMGEREPLADKYISTLFECTRYLLTVEGVADKLRLKDNQPAVIDPDLYHRDIKPLLAESIGRSSFFHVQEKGRPVLIEYLCGSLTEMPSFIETHLQRSEIDLAAGFLQEILPAALQQRLFVDYGPSKQGNGEYARSYSGNDSPIETADLKNPLEAATKTCLLFLHTGLKREQVKKLVDTLQQMAKAQGRKRKVLPEETPIARTFSLWAEGKDLFTYTLQTDEKRWKNLEDKLNDSTPAHLPHYQSAIFTYLKYCVLPQIGYYTKNLRSDSHNFASMFSSFNSGTATPNQDGVFPLGTQVLWDPGTTGDFVDFVCRTTPNDALVVTESRTSEAALLELLNRLCKSGSAISALIDSGALFEGLSNSFVAKKMLRFIEQHRPDLRGVVFYNENQELVVWEKGNDQPIAFERSTLAPEERLTYLDQTHTLGADVIQPVGAVGVVTISSRSTLEQLTQAGGRMRGLKKAQQRLIIAMSHSVKERVCGQEELDIRKIITFTQMNQAAMQGEENYLAARLKIADVTRRAILDKMIFSSSFNKMFKVYSYFEKTLITDAEIDPSLLYGYPKLLVPYNEVLDAFKKAELKLLSSSPYFSSQECAEIQGKLQSIGTEEDSYLDKVAIRKNLLTAPLVGVLGTTQEVEQSKEVHQQQNRELQQEVQVENMEPPKNEPKIRLMPAMWGSKIDYFTQLQWLKPQPFSQSPSYNDKNRLEVAIYSVADSLPQFQRLFDGKMTWTNNFLGILEKSDRAEKPLHKRRNPVFELLVVRIDKENAPPSIYTLAIDQYETAGWRRRFEESRQSRNLNPRIQIGLFDLSLQTVVDTGYNALTTQTLFESPSFITDLVRWKFLAGHTNIRTGMDPKRDKQLMEAAHEWLSPFNLEVIKRLHQEIYRRHGYETYRGSDMEMLMTPEEDLLFYTSST